MKEKLKWPHTVYNTYFIDLLDSVEASQMHPSPDMLEVNGSILTNICL
jgi:hypothetical protein